MEAIIEKDRTFRSKMRYTLRPGFSFLLGKLLDKKKAYLINTQFLSTYCYFHISK